MGGGGRRRKGISASGVKIVDAGGAGADVGGGLLVQEYPSWRGFNSRAMSCFWSWVSCVFAST